jgi:hypothetical protein
MTALKDKIINERLTYYSQNKENRREYYLRNKENITQNNRDYYSRNKGKIAQRRKENYCRNKEKIATTTGNIKYFAREQHRLPSIER